MLLNDSQPDQYLLPVHITREDVLFLLCLLPVWVTRDEPGLCSTMYGAGSYEGDRLVVDRVLKIRESVS
jgi:hypothetical protein